VARASLTDVPGIGPVAAADLASAGIRTVSALARTPTPRLAALPGFGPARAHAVKLAAESLLAQHSAEGLARGRATGEAQRFVAARAEQVAPAAGERAARTRRARAAVAEAGVAASDVAAPEFRTSQERGVSEENGLSRSAAKGERKGKEGKMAKKKSKKDDKKKSKKKSKKKGKKG
jgi:hypothetical protein